MTRAAALALSAGAVAGLALGGCESTTQRASRIADQGSQAFTERGLSVRRVSSDVRVVSETVLSDENGTAAVVTLRSRARRTLGAVPIAIDVAGAGGRSIFKNDAPGLSPALAAVPTLPPGRRVTWVNDQVIAAPGDARRVSARVGRARPAGPIPRVSLVGRPVIERDPGGSVTARGALRNDTEADLRDVVVYGVARRDGRVVAAGRSIVPRLRAGMEARFAVFFIGDPRGGTLEVTPAPFPTTEERQG